jgi:hypothetical protein
MGGWRGELDRSLRSEIVNDVVEVETRIDRHRNRRYDRHMLVLLCLLLLLLVLVHRVGEQLPGNVQGQWGHLRHNVGQPHIKRDAERCEALRVSGHVHVEVDHVVALRLRYLGKVKGALWLRRLEGQREV